MEYKNFEELIHSVSANGKRRVAVAAAHDEHALDAVLLAAKEGLVDYMLVGDAAKIRAIGKELGYLIDSAAIINTADDISAAKTAVTLIREKKADFLMKGKLETAVLMRAVLDKETGIRTESGMSHIALHQLPAYHKLLAVTDGGMIPYPTLDQKIQIIKNAVELFRSLGYEQPKVAVLAASETVNERMPETADAKALKDMAKNGAFGSCIVEGPLSFDLAISRESAEIKGVISPVNNDVDILVVPNIASGNILGKSLVYMGGAKMAGCIVGAKVPIVLTSRGASTEEKHLSILLSAASATNNQ